MHPPTIDRSHPGAYRRRALRGFRLPSKAYRFGATLSLAALVTACSSQGSTDFTPIQASLDSFVSTDAAPASGSVAGYSFALTTPFGTVYKTAGGDQKVDDVVAIASATKLPSAMAILTLVDAGKLNLDEPVATYFAALDPTFPWPRDKQAITMRMLLSHTAGIPSPPDPATTDCLNNTFSTLRACAADIAQAPLDYPPGTTFSYSGADYQVAGYLAELLSGQKWQDYFAAAVATPLGLSTFSYGDTDNPRIAGGASCDVDDYAKILRMLLDGGVNASGKRVLSAAMIDELKKNEIAGLPTNLVPFPADEQADYPGYTMSLWISAPSLYQPLGSPGPEYSDPGLFGTTPWVDFGAGYGAIILITQDTQTGIDMWNAARPKILAALGY